MDTIALSNAVGKASVSVTVLYLLFGIMGYLTMARKGVTLDSFNYFLDDRGENIVLYNVARYVTLRLFAEFSVSISLLILFSVC
mgnify:CR=1 FL=1